MIYVEPLAQGAVVLVVLRMPVGARLPRQAAYCAKLAVAVVGASFPRAVNYWAARLAPVISTGSHD